VGTLDNKVAVVYGAAGPMGGAIAGALADAGASLHLAGHSPDKLKAVAESIRQAEGTAETAELDVDDRAAVERHADAVIERAGRIDIACNAVGTDTRQNRPMVDLSVDEFMLSIDQAMRRHFITMTAMAKRMSAQGSGVIVTLTASASKEWRHQMGGFSIACQGIETISRTLAAEVGPDGVRIVCIRANFTPETIPGTKEEDLGVLTKDTFIGRLPRLREIGAAAVYAASDDAGAMTGAVLNLTCGAIVD
jgi:3-oxoacyl-[acyl-carrier protein] reductase